MRTLVARLAALLLALCGLAAVSTAPASAHDQIISSDPADGTVLAHSPTQITLTFSDDIQAVGNQVVVVDELGNEIAAGAPTVVGAEAVLALPMLTNTAYSVTWRVVSSDGHPIDGTFAFTVDDPVVGPTAPADQVPADPATTAPAPPEATPTEPTTTEAAENAADAEDAPSLPWPGIIVGGLLGLAAGIGLLQLAKRRRTED